MLRPLTRPLCIFAFCAVISPAAGLAQCSLNGTVTQAISAGGDFNTASTWNNGVPNSMTSACIVAGTSGAPTAVTLNGAGYVANVQVNANNTLNLSNASTLSLGGPSTINNGEINLNAGTLIITGTTLSGSGTVQLSGAQINSAGGGPLKNTGNTIQGSGAIGGNGLMLTNSATISANASGQTLTVNAAFATNSGVLQATNSGTLQLSTQLTNIGSGQIVADGGTVRVSGAVNGGTLRTLNGGLMETAGSAALGGVTLASGSVYSTGNGATTTILDAALTNSGTLQVTAGVNNATLTGNTNFSISGGGTIVLGSTGNGTATLSGIVNNADNLIEGAGSVTTNAGLANGGTISANVSGKMLTLSGPGLYNNNLLVASGSGILNLDENVYNGANAVIRATSGGTVLVDATLSGGTLSTDAGGVIRAGGSNALLTGTTLLGGSTFAIGSGAAAVLLGAIDNQGTIQVSAGAGSATLIAGSATLSGGGTVNLSTSGGGSAVIQGLGTTLNNVDNTIQGAGTLGSGLYLLNSGTISANISGGTLSVNAIELLNSGTLEATNGGILQLSGAVNPSTGIINASGAGSIVQFSNIGMSGVTVSSSLGGVLQTQAGATVLFAGVTIAPGSTYIGQNGSTTSISGTITNDGSILLRPQTSAVGLSLLSSTTLSGSGSISLGVGVSAPSVITAYTTASLTNAGNTIEGAGAIGNGTQMSIVNQAGGTIEGSVAGQTLTLNGTGALTNAGILAAIEGGALAVNMTLSSTTFNSGKLMGGYIVDGSTGHVSTLRLIDLGSSGGEVTTIGDGTNAGSLTLNGTKANTIFEDSNKDALALATISSTGALTVEGGYALTAPGALNNSGSLRIGEGSSVTVTGVYSGNGMVTIASGGALSANALTFSGGLIQLDGALDSQGSALIDLGASLFGNGLVGTNLIDDGDVFAGDSGIPGELDVFGNYTEGSTGVLDEVIGGTQTSPETGLLYVTGNVTFQPGASINIDSLAYMPGNLEEYEVLMFTGTLTGTLTVTGADASYFRVLYNANSVDLVWATPEPSYFWVVGVICAAAWLRRRKAHCSKQF